jgi:hypothetical protein
VVKLLRGPWLLVWLMAATVVALLVALVVTKGDDGVDAKALLEAAPAAVDEQGSAKLDMKVGVDSSGLDLNVDGTGAVDFGKGAGWFTVKLLGTTIDLRTDGENLWVLPSGEKTWLAVKGDDTKALGSFGTGPSEAIAFVDLLRNVNGDIEDLGTKTIDGEDVRHLRLDVDLDAAAKTADADSRASIDALRELAPDGTLPLEVWIDDRNLPVRQRLRGTLQGVDLVITMDLSDWGTDLGVDIPPQGDVRDIEPDELNRIFGGSTQG